MISLSANPGKKIEIATSQGIFQRFPIKTHVITANDNISEIVQKYVSPHWQPQDLLFISERIVAISQGRAFPISDIKPSGLAKFLTKFVHKSPYGIGLGSPWTMQLALQEAGAARILLAAAVAALTKPFGLRGVFYHVAGKNINAIDGPCDYTLPPYNQYAKLGPKNADSVAKQIASQFGLKTAIIDANDLGLKILGKSDKSLDNKLCAEIFRDNPLGQASEQTPICLVRLLTSYKT